MAINTPQFPIYAWRMTFGRDVQYIFIVNSNPHILTIPAGEYEPLNQVSETGASRDGSITKLLSDQLTSILVSEFPTFTPSMFAYVQPLPNSEPVLRFRTTGVPVGQTMSFLFMVTTFPELHMLGATQNVALPFGGSAVAYTLTMPAPIHNVWQPNSLTFYDDRHIESMSVRAQAVYTTNTMVKSWGTEKVYVQHTHPVVHAARIFGYRKLDNNFANPALVSVSKHTTLEDMYQAARDNKTITFITGYGDVDSGDREELFYMGDGIKSSDADVEDISARGALFEVQLQFVKAGD